MKLSRRQLLDQFKEQIQFLSTSARLYDEGQYHEAKRIAVVLRTLFHDTTRSRALMTQLGALETLWFTDTCESDYPGNVCGFNGLTAMRFYAHEARHFPKFDSISIGEWHRKRFSRWWTQVVVRDMEGNVFSRKSLILSLANQDGGAHVDSELNEAYAKLSRLNSFGITAGRPEQSQGALKGLELASIRQVAWEVLSTFQRRFPYHFVDMCFISRQLRMTCTPQNDDVQADQVGVLGCNRCPTHSVANGEIANNLGLTKNNWQQRGVRVEDALPHQIGFDEFFEMALFLSSLSKESPTQSHNSGAQFMQFLENLYRRLSDPLQMTCVRRNRSGVYAT